MSAWVCRLPAQRVSLGLVGKPRRKDAVLRRELEHLFKLALPLILAQIAQNAMGFIDTLMVGRLGNSALAGIALGGTVFGFVMLVFSGVILAVGPTVSQAHGGGRPEEAARAVRQGLWLGTFLVVPATALFWLSEPLLLALGQEAGTAALASRYLRAIGWGLLPAFWWVALRGLLEGQGVTRPIMLISFVGVGLNIVFNNALMFGLWGLPALGLVGTGYASSLVYALICGAGALYVARSFPQHRIFQGLWTPDWAMLRQLVRVGTPIALTLGFEVSMFATTAVLMGLLGAPQLAAHQIALQTASITFMVPLGLAIATSVRVGQALGRGEFAAARRSGYLGMGSSVLVMCLSALAFWLFPRSIIGLYLDVNDPANAAVVALATGFLAIAAMFQLFDGLQVSSAGALRGFKDTRVPMLMTLFAYWGVGISSGALLCFAFGLGGTGLWLGLVFGLATAALLLAWRFNRRTRSVDAPPIRLDPRPQTGKMD